MALAVLMVLKVLPAKVVLTVQVALKVPKVPLAEVVLTLKAVMILAGAIAGAMVAI